MANKPISQIVAIGGEDGGYRADVTSDNALKVTPVAGGTPQDVNLTKVGGTAVSLGQKAMAASIPVALASDQSGIVLASGTDRSGAITTGGTAQQLAAANAARHSLTGQNISSGDLWINETGGTAAANTAGSFRVASGASFAVSTSAAVSVVGATTGQKFTATET